MSGEVPIEDVDLGTRVLLQQSSDPVSLDPSDVDSYTTIDASTWRVVTLVAGSADRERIEIELLRPEIWLRAHDIEASRSVYISLPELGFEGQVHVLRVDTCPESLDGATARGLVVSLFSSQSSVIELLLEGSDEPLQVTPGHMIFSLDRATWIPAGKLRRGEKLATMDGQVRLLEIRGGGEPLVVRNLEILGSHRYHVGSAGVLAHNMCAPRSGAGASPGNPVGRSGSPLKNAPSQPVRNASGSVGGRQYSGHAFDQMQNRGLTPSVVENTIQHGRAVPGKYPGTTVHYDSVNNVSVVTDTVTGRVVTASPGQLTGGAR